VGKSSRSFDSRARDDFADFRIGSIPLKNAEARAGWTRVSRWCGYGEWPRWAAGFSGRRQWCWLDGQFRHLSGRGQEELVASTARTAQSQAIEAQDALEVGEQHLDFLPLSPRRAIGVGLGDGAGHVTSALVDAARHLARRLLGTAALFEAAEVAVVLAGAMEELEVVHDRALAGQYLAARADPDVPLVVVGEVLTRERPIGNGMVRPCGAW
jgi:hypothetical protein